MSSPFPEEQRRAALAAQQNVVKHALMQANESRRRSDSKRRSAVYLAMLCLLLAFSVWRVVRPRETLLAAESVRNAPRRRPLPAHLLALRNPADLRCRRYRKSAKSPPNSCHPTPLTPLTSHSPTATHAKCGKRNPAHTRRFRLVEDVDTTRSRAPPTGDFTPADTHASAQLRRMNKHSTNGSRQ